MTDGRACTLHGSARFRRSTVSRDRAAANPGRTSFYLISWVMVYNMYKFKYIYIYIWVGVWIHQIHQIEVCLMILSVHPSANSREKMQETQHEWLNGCNILNYGCLEIFMDVYILTSTGCLWMRWQFKMLVDIQRCLHVEVFDGLCTFNDV